MEKDSVRERPVETGSREDYLRKQYVDPMLYLEWDPVFRLLFSIKLHVLNCRLVKTIQIL